ncbi:hypothetical protein CEP52_000560 [Fusarium oligoseptatum]|uniref:Uncharacterized protein n=1 Tax=Fusarium oligoseptatum TaxID=2604345 RepID=A0A428UNZ9_9HYPO|nr:hypothetical protein CEP52_000560 [Fusarium oligoseptatum]
MSARQCDRRSRFERHKETDPGKKEATQTDVAVASPRIKSQPNTANGPPLAPCTQHSPRMGTEAEAL